MRRATPDGGVVVVKIGSSSLTNDGLSLDQSAVERLEVQLPALPHQGRPSVLITHDLLHGWRLADRVAILNRGVITADQTKKGQSEADFLAYYREQLGP